MNRTKHAIVATFWQLLEEKTYNKIGITAGASTPGRRMRKEEKGAFTSFSFCKKRVFLKVPKQNGIPCYLYLRRKQNRKSFTCRK